MKRLITYLIIMFLVSCSNPVPAPTLVIAPTNTITEFCSAKEIDAFRNQFMPLLQKYYDQVLATASAAKESMAQELEKLKEVRKNAEGLTSNACTAKLQAALVNALNGSLDGFQAMLSGQSKTIQDAFFEKGTQFIRQINLELARLADCKSNCLP